jgi:hypothetical protein
MHQEPDAGGGKKRFDGAVKQDLEKGGEVLVAEPEKVGDGYPGEGKEGIGGIGQVQGDAAQGASGLLETGQVLAVSFQQGIQGEFVRALKIMGLFEIRHTDELTG